MNFRLIIPESGYPKPMLDNDFAQKRVISAYKSGLKS